MYYNNDTVLESCMKIAAISVMGGLMGVVAILINILLDVLMAVPFWLFWTIFGIGDKYFYFLPVIYHNISLWHCISIFICLETIRWVLLKNSSSVHNK